MTDMLLHSSALEAQMTYSKALAASDLLPAAYRGKPANVLVALALGEALGLSPTTALYGINVIQGKPTLSAETMRAVVLGHGHTFDVVAFTAEEAVVRVARRERPGDTSDFSFTSEDAHRAGLTGGNYDKYPKAMLLARATSQACRAVFPDVLAGVSYTPEELEAPAPAGIERIVGAEPTDDDWATVREELEAPAPKAGRTRRPQPGRDYTPEGATDGSVPTTAAAPWDEPEELEAEPEVVEAVIVEPTIDQVVDHVTKTRAYNLMRGAGYTGRKQMVDFAAGVLARDPGTLTLTELGTRDFEAIIAALSEVAE